MFKMYNEEITFCAILSHLLPDTSIELSYHGNPAEGWNWLRNRRQMAENSTCSATLTKLLHSSQNYHLNLLHSRPTKRLLS